MLSSLLRPLRGANLEVLKFGMYIMFPIGWMYYFGTNLEERFDVPGFWPTQQQGHRIPFERDEIVEEVRRIQREGAEIERQRERRKEMRERVEEMKGGGGEGIMAMARRRRKARGEGEDAAS